MEATPYIVHPKQHHQRVLREVDKENEQFTATFSSSGLGK